jgi:tryptophan-rich sensory protein
MFIAAREVDEPAAIMTVPLLFWLGFAALLSEELWRRNPNLSRY